MKQRGNGAMKGSNMRWIRCLTATTISLLGAHAGAASFPPPGEYRIDSQSTTIHNGPAGRIETVLRTDGGTGTVTQIQKPAFGGPPVTRTYKGAGPQTWCIGPGALPPAAALANNCASTYAPTATGAKLATDCAGVKINDEFRRIDDRTWERENRTIQATLTPSSGADAMASVKAAMAMASAGMTPAEFARARAEMSKMPSAADIDGSKASLIAAIEAELPHLKGEEAAAARAQLAMLKGTGPTGGSGAPARETLLKERWTRIAERCTPKR